MGKADYYAPDDYNASCYECGRKFKASQLLRHWQGYYVCKEHWEPRQPQDFVRAIPDNQTPPWEQPPSTTYAEFCSPNDQTAIPRRAIPACVKPGYISPAYDSSAPYGD